MIYSGRVIRRIVIVALFLALVGGIVAATIVTWPVVPAVAVLAVLLGGAVLLALQWEWRHRVWQEWERRIGELEYAYRGLDELWTPVREHYRRTPSGDFTRVRAHPRRLTTLRRITIPPTYEIFSDLRSNSARSYSELRQKLSELPPNFSYWKLQPLLSELENIIKKEKQWEPDWKSSPGRIAFKWVRTVFKMCFKWMRTQLSRP